MSANVFEAHLDECCWCRDHPFDLCPTGAELLVVAATKAASQLTTLGMVPPGRCAWCGGAIAPEATFGRFCSERCMRAEVNNGDDDE